MGVHGFQEVQGSRDVVAVVAQWFVDRFAYGFQAGKVDHSVHRVVLKDPVKCHGIGDVRLQERQLASGDFLHPQQRFVLRVAEVVDGGDVVAALKQAEDGVGTDVAAATGD